MARDSSQRAEQWEDQQARAADKLWGMVHVWQQQNHAVLMLSGCQGILPVNFLDPHQQPSRIGTVGYCVTHISQVRKLDRRRFAGVS